MSTLQRLRHLGDRTRRNSRRAIQTLTTFDNGFRVLGDIVIRRPDELCFSLDGLEVVCPNVRGARFAVYELFTDDAYHLPWFTQGLGSAPVVLDLGGHIGSFSLAINRLFPDALIDAFEPTPSTATYLRRNVETNGLSDRIRVFESAISARAGTLMMAVCDDGSAHNGVMLEGTPGTTTIEVPTTPLQDAFAAARGQVDLVKLDIEGAEYEAILESSPELWRSVQRVVMEYHHMPDRSWADLEAFFATVGLLPVRHDPQTPHLGLAWLSRVPL